MVFFCSQADNFIAFAIIIDKNTLKACGIMIYEVVFDAVYDIASIMQEKVRLGDI